MKVGSILVNDYNTLLNDIVIDLDKNNGSYRLCFYFEEKISVSGVGLKHSSNNTARSIVMQEGEHGSFKQILDFTGFILDIENKTFSFETANTYKEFLV